MKKYAATIEEAGEAVFFYLEEHVRLLAPDDYGAEERIVEKAKKGVDEMDLTILQVGELFAYLERRVKDLSNPDESKRLERIISMVKQRFFA